jgi:hypothetical protein
MQLDELARGANTLRTGGSVALAHVLRLTRTLCDELIKHIVCERKILVPALRDTDSWGEIRARTLVDRLRARRRELKGLRNSCVNAENETLAGDIDRFIDARRSDMAQTERDSLNRDVLRDDVIVIDSHGG